MFVVDGRRKIHTPRARHRRPVHPDKTAGVESGSEPFEVDAALGTNAVRVMEDHAER